MTKRIIYGAEEQTYVQATMAAFFGSPVSRPRVQVAAWAPKELELRSSSTRKETREEQKNGIREYYPSLETFGF